MSAVAVLLTLGWPGASSAEAPAARADDRVHMTHADAVGRLRQAGIPWWSSGGCSDRRRTDCTSFEQIRRSTIEGVITLKQASSCPILVTGGTEAGHGSGTYTHWNGWKVDIARYDCVSAYIRSGFQHVGYISGWGTQYKAPSGNLYTDEGDHWDILYYTCGGCGPAPASPSPKPSVTASPSVTTSPSVSVGPSVSLSPEPPAPEPSTPPSAPPAHLTVAG